MRVTFELGTGARRPLGWRGALATVYLGGAAVAVVVLITAAIRGDAAMVENAGVALTFMIMFGAPAWVAHALGRRATSQSAVEHELVRLRETIDVQNEEMRAVKKALAQLGGVVQTLERIEEHIGTTTVRRFPAQGKDRR